MEGDADAFIVVCFGTTPIRLLPREGTVVRMFHLHAALDHGAYGCRQRHQLKSRAVLATSTLTRGVERSSLLSHPSGVALLQTDDVSPGRSGSVREVKTSAISQPGETAISTPASAYVSSVGAVNAMTV